MRSSAATRCSADTSSAATPARIHWLVGADRLPHDSAAAGRSVLLSPRHVLLPVQRDARPFTYPPAFDEYAQRSLKEHMPGLIEVRAGGGGPVCVQRDRRRTERRAEHGLSAARGRLAEGRFPATRTELDEFIKAGGSAKCLTLRLDGEDAAGWPEVIVVRPGFAARKLRWALETLPCRPKTPVRRGKDLDTNLNKPDDRQNGRDT